MSITLENNNVTDNSLKGFNKAEDFSGKNEAKSARDLSQEVFSMWTESPKTGTSDKRTHPDAGLQYVEAGVLDAGRVPVSELRPEDKLQLLDKALEKHQKNLEKMQKHVANGTASADKLKDFVATAGGQRTKAYDAESPYIQQLVDKFEGQTINNVQQAFAMAVGGASEEIQFGIEITRTKQFIEILQKEHKAQLNELGITEKQYKNLQAPDAPGPVGGAWSTAAGDKIKFVVEEGGLVRGVVMNGKNITKTVFMGSADSDVAVSGNWSRLDGSKDQPVKISVSKAGVLVIEPETAGAAPIIRMKKQ
ncbi:MAG: hypothetical protein K2X77_19350 [Candidatus Obscuribacterales bacterium]|jgi:hypothetical protein|nr:hypothetical protein [Candidatus Obscuribacterales bacterium]